jgi:hypothetical protein
MSIWPAQNFFNHKMIPTIYNMLRWRTSHTLPQVGYCDPGCWHSFPHLAGWSRCWEDSETGSALVVGSLSGCGWCCMTAAVSMGRCCSFSKVKISPASLPHPHSGYVFFLLLWRPAGLLTSWTSGWGSWTSFNDKVWYRRGLRHLEASFFICVPIILVTFSDTSLCFIYND